MSKTTPRLMPDLCNRRFPHHYVTALNLLIRAGVDINAVDILAVGEYANYRGEIQSQEPAPGTPLDEDTRIVLSVGFPSAVDQMPYQFFYGIAGITSRTGEWEDKARALMAPFDSSVVRFFSRAVNDNLKYSLGLADIDYLRRYLELFDFTMWEDSPDHDEALLWAAIFPTFQHWAGNARLVAEVLESLFGYSFRVVENVPLEYAIPEDIRSRLRSRYSRLGEDMILGRSFRECDSACEVQVSGVDPHDVADLLPGKSWRRKLEWVISECMPNDLVCKIRIAAREGRFVLGDKQLAGHLGYSAYLQSGF